MTEFLSDHLASTRDAFKRHVHGGKTFSSEEITALVGRLSELIAMAKYLENDISRRKWNEAARRENPTEQRGNILPFTGVRREPMPPNGGGNAA